MNALICAFNFLKTIFVNYDLHNDIFIRVESYLDPAALSNAY